MKEIRGKTLKEWKEYCKDESVPIKTMKYIAYLEERIEALTIPDVLSRFSDEKLAQIAEEQVHIGNGCFGELDFTQGQREGFEDGLAYFRDVILNGL